MINPDELKTLTVGQLFSLESQIPLLNGVSKRLLIHDYDSFVDAVIEDLEWCSAKLQENPELHGRMNEDQITIQIKNMMEAKNYLAFHDCKHGGHTDLMIKHNEYKYIAEAKICNGVSYLWGGWQQLCTRYITGDANNYRNAILIYIKTQPNARAVMEEWGEYILQQEKSASIIDCRKWPLSKITNHIHAKSGLSVEVRHIPVMLLFSPQDKSGLNRKTKTP